MARQYQKIFLVMLPPTSFPGHVRPICYRTKPSPPAYFNPGRRIHKTSI